MIMKTQIIFYIIALSIRILLFYNQSRGNYLEIAFLDVGQGDSVLITTPLKKRVLIDGGEGFTADRLLDSYFPLNNCHLDVLALTHPHADHIEGLNRVLDHCKVDFIIFNPVEYDSYLYDNWLSKVSELENSGKSKVFNCVDGDVIKIDGITFHCIWPTPEALEKGFSNINNASLTVFLDYGDFEAFLSGDAETGVLEIIKKRLNGGAFWFIDYPLEVYKASHHGAENGFVKGLWIKLNPGVTVVSVGEDNKFGHPSQDVIDFFTAKKCTDFFGSDKLCNLPAAKKGLVKRTDMDGTVKIRYNLSKYEHN